MPADYGEIEGFNTQPPEGGWIFRFINRRKDIRFNTQPPEGGWAAQQQAAQAQAVSTHSRPKAAGKTQRKKQTLNMFQHTAARRRLGA